MRVQQFERIQELMRNVTVDIGSSVDDYQEHLELTGPVWAEYLERLASSLSSKHRAVRSLYMGISDKPILEAVDKAYEDSSAWLYASADAVTNRVARPEGLVMPADALETVTWAVHDRIGELGL